MLRLGQILQDERTGKKITLEEASKATRIRLEFLRAIEKGEYNKLPSAAYAIGFVRNYVEYLGLPKKDMLALFRREFDEEREFEVLPEGLSRIKEFPIKKIKTRTFIGIVLLFLVSLSYVFFQYRSAFTSPTLSIESPKEGSEVIAGELHISGKTDANTTVQINNTAVLVDENGSFSKTLDVFPGRSTITIKALNSFGKETTVTRILEVKEK